MGNKGIWLILVCLMVLVLVLPACSAPTTTNTQAPTSSVPVTTTTTSTPTTTASTTGTSTPTSTATTPAEAKPQGELIVAFPDFGNENFIPWKGSLGSSQIMDEIYDLLIYWDEINRKYLPGLAESWEVTPDALTTTYHLRKGIQFQDGWGELTSDDIKYNFEMQASTFSVGKTSQSRRIASMDTPDPYTIIIHMKAPYPAFFAEFSIGNSGVDQGFACKKYVETVGEEAASEKPIGTGPYKMIESQPGVQYRLEAQDSHWRVVPEFKTLTVRAIPEVSSVVAALKNKEIDLANVPAEQLAGLQAAGVATESSSFGSQIIVVSMGGMVVPEDKRYDAAVDNKDPWANSKVRQAMAIAIDREAINQAIYAGTAFPVGVPLFSKNMDDFQYPYDPEGAKQLLKDAGYPNGFSFEAISYIMPGAPEGQRLMEALAGYWQQIGLDPKLTVIDYATYTSKYRAKLQTAGQLSLFRIGPGADILSRMELFLMPNASSIVYQDEESYNIWLEGSVIVDPDEREAYVNKLNQYYYEVNGPIPIVRPGFNFAWNGDKVAPFAHSAISTPYYLEYVRHVQPLNTFRLFSPFPGR